MGNVRRIYVEKKAPFAVKAHELQEELKTMPFGDVWDAYCAACGKPADGAWFGEIEKYEAEILSKRG